MNYHVYVNAAISGDLCYIYFKFPNKLGGTFVSRGLARGNLKLYERKITQPLEHSLKFIV